jgi:hypothetical protein
MNVTGSHRVLACGLLLVVCHCVRASTAASFDLPQQPRGSDSTLVNGVDGFDFTPTADLSVSALGWYDQGGDGIHHDHPVGLYVTATRALAAPAATVTSSSPLDAATRFRFAAVTPFTLTAGTTYTVVGYGEGPAFDPYVSDPAGGITFGPGIDYVRHRTSRSSGLEFPTTAGEIGLIQDLYLGPNFQYAVVPDPASPGLFICAASLLTRRRRSAPG